MNGLKRFLTGMLLTVFVVSAAFGQTTLINETFGTVPPSNWTNGAIAPTHGTVGDGDAHCLVFATPSSGAISIVTKSVTDPDRVTFRWRSSAMSYSGTFTLKYSTNVGGPFSSTVATLTGKTTTYTLQANNLGLTGTYYFQLERSAGTRDDLYIDNFIVTQSIVRSTSSLSGFLYEPSSGPSSEQSFTVSAVDLTANLVLTAPTNYEISKTSSSGFTSSLSYTPSSGVVASSTVYVRLKSGLSEGSYNNETITISSTGKVSKTVICSGDVRTSISVSTASLTNFNYDPGSGPSAEQNFSVSGQDLTNNITLTPPTNYEISTGTGGGFSASNPITLTQSGGTVNATSIYVRLKAGLSQGTYNSENISVSSAGKVTKTVSCSGFVGPLILNVKVFLEGGLW
jgi:hypothetical protein